MTHTDKSNEIADRSKLNAIIGAAVPFAYGETHDEVKAMKDRIEHLDREMAFAHVEKQAIIHLRQGRRFTLKDARTAFYAVYEDEGEPSCRACGHPGTDEHEDCTNCNPA